MSQATEMTDAETPKLIDVKDFDLTTLKSYTGPALLSRLHHISSSTFVPLSLRSEALKLLRDALKDTLNTDMYRKTFTEGDEEVRKMAGGQIDEEWLDSTSKTSSTSLSHLDANLQHSKTTLQKPLILSSYRSIASHHLLTGSLVDALKCYLRSRDFLPGANEISQMCLDVVGVSVELKNFQHVMSYCNKAEHTNEFKKDDVTNGKISACKGLALLHQKNYSLAASAFTSLPPPFPYPTTLTPSTIALYSSVLSLATSPPSTLKSLLQNPTYKTYLYGHPLLQTLLESYTLSNYTLTLQTFTQLLPQLHLDVHLGPHKLVKLFLN
ncbi:hypothetical protein TrST_g10361 [Triparma strigata]|uniref:26S proteasome regulatory subunit Rpn7 N-terminal domain-containing protein n=1 Tax=Triparma strigata TaxID=1606541 RepID=A0A9W7EJ88_9STRA|nr:hypothetical protein TrST_g10361 [Triparma strigata]